MAQQHNVQHNGGIAVIPTIPSQQPNCLPVSFTISEEHIMMLKIDLCVWGHWLRYVLVHWWPNGWPDRAWIQLSAWSEANDEIGADVQRCRIRVHNLDWSPVFGHWDLYLRPVDLDLISESVDFNLNSDWEKEDLVLPLWVLTTCLLMSGNTRVGQQYAPPIAVLREVMLVTCRREHYSTVKLRQDECQDEMSRYLV